MLSWERAQALSDAPIAGMPVKVILVGNSVELLERRDGAIIDSMDRVVRFNGGNPSGRSESLGERTDYWSFSTMVAEQYHQWRIPGAVPMLLNLRIKYPVTPEGAIYNDFETYSHLRDTYQHPRPSTGLITAHYIARNWDCDLYCIGFDFFETATWYRGSNKNIPHNGALERSYMKSLGAEIL